MEGNKRIDELMIPVRKAILKHVNNQVGVTEIYNRAYEALMASMDENTYDNVVTEKRLNAASDLLEAISIWFYENKGLAGKADPTWTGLYSHACQLFEPTYKEK